MSEAGLRLTRFHRVGAPVHAVALSGDGEHLLVGSESGLRLVDRRGSVKHRAESSRAADQRAFSAVALSPNLDVGLALERAGRLYRLEFEQPHDDEGGQRLQVASTGIWEQRDDLYSLAFAPRGGEDGAGLIALGHHVLGVTALDARGRLLWQLGPHEGAGLREPVEGGTGDRVKAGTTPKRSSGPRTWQAAISEDGRTIYAASLGGGTDLQRRTVVAVDAAVGKPVRSAVLAGPVLLLVGLPEPLGFAAVFRHGTSPGHCCRLDAYDARLAGPAWSLACPPEVAITAAASVPGKPALLVGTNTGELWRIGAYSGRLLDRHDLLFSSTVLSIAVAESGEVAVGLANGQVAFLERVNR